MPKKAPPPPSDDALVGTLEAILLEQTQAPWQSRTARWSYRTEFVADLLPEPEPEPEPEPDAAAGEGADADQEEEQDTEEGGRLVTTLGQAKAALARSAELTHDLQTKHMRQYAGSSENGWRTPRLYSVPGRDSSSLLRRELPLPLFSMWRAAAIESAVDDALVGNLGHDLAQLRRQEEHLLARLDALSGAAELARWRGEDPSECGKYTTPPRHTSLSSGYL